MKRLPGCTESRAHRECPQFHDALPDSLLVFPACFPTGRSGRAALKPARAPL